MGILTTWFPRRQPSLPQNDKPRQQKQRAQQLALSQKTYQWTDELPNVVGVPMATRVPAADEPSLPWILLVTEIGLELARNLIAVKLASEELSAAESKKASTKYEDVHKRLQAIRTLHKDRLESPELDLSVSMVVSEAKQFITGGHLSFSSLLEEFQELVQEYAIIGAPKAGLASYEMLFQTIELPTIAHTFMDDQAFARYRVAGPNPMLIKCISKLPTNLPLTDAQFKSVIGEHDSLAAALKESRVYLLDYVELTKLAAENGTTDGLTKYLTAPLALFAIPKGGNSITPVAIQCGQVPGKNNPLFFPAAPKTAGWWGWQMAKTVVQAAEGNYHELFVHLARTHLMMEAFAVATHRQLAESHPLNVLLLPNFIGTLFINNSAANSLIAAGGPIDEIFAAPIANTQAAAGNDRLNYDFYANMLPADLKRRGVADRELFPDYPYRDDAILVWDAIAAWVKDYVGVYYADDAAVKGDTELAAWTKSLMTEGKVKGFKTITGRKQLVDVLTMIIFTATAQHAAVNFPQKPLMTYAPALTGATWQPAPTQTERRTEKQWLNMLPPVKPALEQLNILYLLGSVHYRELGDYRSNQFPYLPWFEDKAIIGEDGPLARFQQSLLHVETVIKSRNSLRISYEFLLPSRIPNSINI